MMNIKPSVFLPYITDELYEEFCDTCLISWDKETDRPDWTQTAVDFVAQLPILVEGVNDESMA